MTAFAAPQTSRLVGLLLFLGIPAVMLTFSALNLIESSDNSYVAQEKEIQLSALMRRLTSPNNQDGIVDMSRIYTAGNTAALASASLQEHVVKAIASASGKLIETSAMDIDGDPERQLDDSVGIRASFDIDNDGLLTVLHRLETGLPLVFVSKLSVRRLPSESANNPAILRITLEAISKRRISGQ